MRLETIKTMINNYRVMLNNGNKDVLKKLFADAEVLTFEKASFPKYEVTEFAVYFGLEGSTLYGFLTTDHRHFSQWDDKTDVIGTVFTKLSESEVEEYAKGIDNKAEKDHTNFISGDEVKKRIELWKSNKNKWIDTHVSANTVVRFFEVPTAGFVNDETNYMVLGINTSNSQIDLMIGNDTGLYDMVRPVPPFPRNTKWPKWPF